MNQLTSKDASPKLRRFMRAGIKIALAFVVLWIVVSLAGNIYHTFVK